MNAPHWVRMLRSRLQSDDRATIGCRLNFETD